MHVVGHGCVGFMLIADLAFCDDVLSPALLIAIVFPCSIANVSV